MTVMILICQKAALELGWRSYPLRHPKIIPPKTGVIMNKETAQKLIDKIGIDKAKQIIRDCPNDCDLYCEQVGDTVITELLIEDLKMALIAINDDDEKHINDLKMKNIKAQETIRRLLNFKTNRVLMVNGIAIKFDSELALQSFKLGLAVANKINQSEGK